MSRVARLRTCAALVAGALVLGCVAPPAGAETTIDRPFLPESGPVFAGATLIWAEERVDRGFDLWTMGVAGGRPQTLQAFPSPPRTDGRPKLAASDRRVILENHLYRPSPGAGDPTWTAVQAFSGAIGEQLAALGPGCEVGTTNEWLVPVGASGERVGYLGPGCDPASSIPGVTVSDFGTGTRRDTAFRPDRYATLAVRLAGAFAGLFGETARIYDLRTGALVYAPPGVGVGAGPAVPGSLAMRADGAVAFEGSGSRAFRSRVGWASPAEPYVHWLALPEAGHYALRWVGDRLLLASGRYSTGTVSDATLAVLNLRGRVEHVVARGAADLYMNERFDTDGTRVAFVTRTCDAAQIHVVALADRTRSYPVPRRCPLLLARRPHLRGGVISLRLSCRGSIRLCRSCDVRVTAADPTKSHRAEPIAYLTSCEPGGQVTLRLNARGLQRFRGGRPVRVRIIAQVGDPSIVVGGDTTGIVAREKTLTLRAGR
jgi:hypothetical protein